MHISSTSNSLIKDVQHIREKARARFESKSFLVEGRTEIEAALRAGFKMRTLFCLEDSVAGWDHVEAKKILLSPKVMARLSLREDGGAVAWFDDHLIATRFGLEALKRLHLSKTPLLVILEGVEKPGNLGAIFRSAAAAGVDAVLVCADRCDLFHPQTIRNSIGAVFGQQVVIAAAEDVISFCRAQKISLHAAHLSGERSLYHLDLKESSAFVIGSEAKGLSSLWTNAISPFFKIPMESLVDSLNVSVATAVCLFEARRQRL